MSLHSSLLASGGKIVVAGGRMNPGWRSYQNHPQLVFWCGDQNEIARHLKNGDNLPNNTKGVIMSRFISHAESNKIIAEAKRKRAVIFAMKNDGEITRLLEEIMMEDKKVESQPQTHVSTEPKTLRKPKHGELYHAVEKNYDASIPNVDNVHKIIEILAKDGIQSTHGSIANTVYTLKKKLGIQGVRAVVSHGVRKVVETPAPPIKIVKPAKKQQTGTPEDDLLKVLDDAMLSLQLVREEVVKFRSQRGDYEQLKTKLSALLSEAK
jgi:hypothetical protein